MTEMLVGAAIMLVGIIFGAIIVLAARASTSNEPARGRAPGSYEED